VVTGLKPFLFLIFLTFFLHIFFSNDKISFTLWYFEIPKQGLIDATFIASRLLIIILLMSYLTLTTTYIEIAEGIEILLSPLKIVKFPVSEVSLMLSISLRFIPTVLEETQKIINAQKSRGIDFKQGSLTLRAKKYLSVLIPLLNNTFTRSEELANVLELRLFNPEKKRTKMYPTTFSKIDFLFIFVFVILICNRYFING
jgi:energy-coupling factor transport system permease protein